MKVLVLGCTGMLGSAVTRHLVNAGYVVTATCREKSFDVACKSFSKVRLQVFDPMTQDLRCEGFERQDYIINCIGVIKPAIKDVGVANTIEINSVFPHRLAAWCYGNDICCINITTDCVYSGAKGGYIETDIHDANDLYGRSKSLGEEMDLGMLIRTSIVGEEIHNNTSLIEWAKSMKGQPTNGFTDHLWNGITTTEYAKLIDWIMQTDMFRLGLFHVFSPQPMTKYEMLRLFSDRFDLGLNINPVRSNSSINRTLATVKDLNEKLHIPSFDQQIAEM